MRRHGQGSNEVDIEEVMLGVSPLSTRGSLWRAAPHSERRAAHVQVASALAASRSGGVR